MKAISSLERRIVTTSKKVQTLTTAFERIVSEYLNAQDDEKEKADTK